MHSRRQGPTLSSDVLLVHFDPSKKLALSCRYGVGVVLSHPTAYATGSLAHVEKNYSQMKKEGLSVVWAGGGGGGGGKKVSAVSFW